MAVLQETISEMDRNGCKKILIVNGHGGNVQWLEYFIEVQLNSLRDYVVYLAVQPQLNPSYAPYAQRQ